MKYARQNFPVTQHSGFTLIEIAIVLVIVGLLLSSILVPLGSAFEQSQRKTVKGQLQEIHEALIGFAAANERLPCPSTGQTAGTESIADGATGQCTVTHGFVPSTTLGLFGAANTDGLLLDVWGNPLRYSVSAQNDATAGFYFTRQAGMANKGMRNLASSFEICITAGTSCVAENTRANEVPVVVFSMGKDWRSFSGNNQLENAGEGITGGNFDAVLRGGTTGIDYPVPNDDIFVSSAFNQIEGDEKFDDLLIWLSENVLYARLIQAGVLP